MIIINKWNGRLGNNILQLIRAIYYAKLNNHNIIKFNKLELIDTQEINIETNNKINNKIIVDSFFYLKKYNINDPEPYEMKNIFQKYIIKYFKINYNTNNSDDLYIHFRGSDIFSSNPHKAYVQPPLYYYKQIINNYNNIKYISNKLQDDLSILSNISNLVIGFGTFGFLLYLMNPNLKKLYIPDYFINELPKGKWGNIELNVIELPNYIKVGDWKFNDKQRNLMLNY